MSIEVKCELSTRQVWIRKTNRPEPLLTRRNPENWHQNQRRFHTLGRVYRRSGYWVSGVRRIDGVILIWASTGNCGNQSF